MTKANFQFPPTPSVEMVNEKRRCTPAWQKWFIDLVALIQAIKTAGIGVVEPANKVLAGPTTGADALPTFRLLVTADMPGLAGTITITTAKLTAGGVNGTMTFVNGVLTAHVDAT